MATSKSLTGIKKLGGDPIKKSKTPPPPPPKRAPSLPPLTDEQLAKFSNFADSGDTKAKAAYLAKKGLIGADQLLTDHPDITSKNGIINAQSDWKPSAISLMLARARSLNLKTPTEIKANQAALIGALPERLQQAINHPAFSQIHPNYWQTFDSILKDRYASETTTQPLPSLATALASK